MVNKYKRYFTNLLVLMWCSTSMTHCKKEPPPALFITPAPALTYKEQIIRFSSITGVTKTLEMDKILAGVQGSKEDYTIKSILLISTTASAKVSDTSLTFTKPGNIVFHLILKKDYFEDAIIKKCKIIITKNTTPIKNGTTSEPLTFNRVSKAFSGGSFTTSEILAGVTGTKSGYTLKEIKALVPSGVASVTGTKPKLSLRMTKIGSFTATIVLAHPSKSDATISNAQFHIYRDIFTITSDGEVALIASVDKNSLITVIIPNTIRGITVTSIGNRSFRGCSSLTSITIPNSVTSIGSEAFRGCSSLTSITIPNSVTSIGSEAFSGCSSLTSITIPNSVTSIGNYAFSGCSSLTSITIPNSVTSIGDWAFYNCRKLTRITIPNSVTSIGDWAFYNCRKLTRITIPNSVTSIGNRSFRGCSSLTSITLPNSVTSIGWAAFSYCSSLTSITIGNSVTSIGWAAFYGCSSLTSITIPNSVTSIGSEAFRACSSLTSITIPNSVTSIGYWIFSSCSKLAIIRVPRAKVAAWSGALKFQNNATIIGY